MQGGGKGYASKELLKEGQRLINGYEWHATQALDKLEDAAGFAPDYVTH